MKSTLFSFQDGTRVQEGLFDYPTVHANGQSSFIFFGFHKSGTTVLNNCLTKLARLTEFNVVNFSEFLWDKGITISSVNIDTNELFQENGCAYLGFREFPRHFIGNDSVRKLNSIIAVRNPLDMLVSLYYSMKFSHGWPKAGSDNFFAEWQSVLKSAATDDINKFCIDNARLYTYEMSVFETLVNERTLVIRYEDFVYEKAGTLCKISDHIGVPQSRAAMIDLVNDFDIFPDQEDTGRHIRQVHPGNYRSKLSTETITFLSTLFCNSFSKFGYDFNAQTT